MNNSNLVTVHAPAAMKSETRAYWLLTLTALCWGGNAVFARLAVGEISPMLLVMFRWLGVVILIGIFANRYIRAEWHVLRRHLLYIAAMGALGFTAFNAIFYVAAHSTTAINIGIIQGAIPVFVLIGAFLVHRIKVTLLQFSGVILTLLGVALIASGGSLERLTSMAINRGDGLIVIASALYAGYAVGLLKRPVVSSMALFTAIAASAFIASVPLVAVEVLLGQSQWPTPTGWGIVLLITLFPSFLAQIFFIKGVDLIGPGRAGVFINLVPVFASVLAVILIGESFELFQAIALFAVLGGIWVSERGKATG